VHRLLRGSVATYSNAGAAMKWTEKLYALATGFLKSPDMAGVGMPQVYSEGKATGELAQGDG
jgi:hypothetical protein